MTGSVIGNKKPFGKDNMEKMYVIMQEHQPQGEMNVGELIGWLRRNRTRGFKFIITAFVAVPLHLHSLAPKQNERKRARPADSCVEASRGFYAVIKF